MQGLASTFGVHVLSTEEAPTCRTTTLSTNIWFYRVRLFMNRGPVPFASIDQSRSLCLQLAPSIVEGLSLGKSGIVSVPK